jgi:hypothetical protein
MIADDAYQDQAAIALLAFDSVAIVWSRSCRFLVVLLFEVVRANDGILWVKREEVDTAGR